jgi:hypothetical protein
VRRHLARFEALRLRPVEAVAEKITPAVKEAVQEKPSEKIAAKEKLTPAPQETPRQTPGERLTPSIEEMIQKLRQKRQEEITHKQRPAPPPAERPKETPYYAPTVHRPRQGRGMRM